MHILLVVNGFPRIWKPTHYIFFAKQAEALQKAGHQVGVLVEPQFRYFWEHIQHKKYPPPIYKRRFYATDIPVYEVGWDFFPKTSANLQKIGKRWVMEYAFQRYCDDCGKPEVIHAHNAIYSGYIASKFAISHNIPLILTEHYSAILRGKVKPRQLKLMESTFIKSDKLFAVGPSLADAIRPYTGGKAIELIGNLVDVHHFDFAPPPPTDKFVFLMIANFNPTKRHSDTLQAFQRAFKNQSVKLRLVGGGDMIDEMKNLAIQLGIEQQLEFMGSLKHNDIPTVIHNSHCVVSSSLHETFGVNLVEAMACGRPVIATRSGGPQMFVNDTNGYLVPTQNIDALSGAMHMMVQSYDTFDFAHIREQCIEQFSEETIVKKLEKAYRQALS